MEVLSDHPLRKEDEPYHLKMKRLELEEKIAKERELQEEEERGLALDPN